MKDAPPPQPHPDDHAPPPDTPCDELPAEVHERAAQLAKILLSTPPDD